MKILKNILFLVIASIFAVLTSSFVGDAYGRVFGGGTWVDFSSVIGLPLSYLFFLPLLFTAFGDKHKYWWIGLLSIPALAFELYFDLEHIYVPIILALLGWVIGLGISKVLVKKN